MSTGNDNLNLSRSNGISNEKATSSDFASQTEVGVANDYYGKWFFTFDDKAIQYTFANDMARFLQANPTLVGSYTDSMYRLAEGVGLARDFKTMRETLNMLVDVLTRLADLSGQAYLA